MKLQVSESTIERVLPDPPDGYQGYVIGQHSVRWFSVWLVHPDYDYKQGVRTIHSFVNHKGEVYAPLHCKPSNTLVCQLHQLYKQNPFTLITPKYFELKTQ